MGAPDNGSVVETDVLIVGTGPAGSSAALFLATYGVDHLVISKYGWTANSPRAHVTNQRTVEILRDMGVEPDIKAQGMPPNIIGESVFCTSLSGDEIGRVRAWGTNPERTSDYAVGSPCSPCDIPQNLFEPILVGNAASRGSRIRFQCEYLGMVQDEDGITASVRDGITGQTFTVRAKYLIGADGGRSQVAKDIGLPMEGEMDVAGSMNIVFHADLSSYVDYRPGVLYWVLQPGSNIGGVGMGVIRMVRPWDEWLAIWGYDINEPPPQVTDEMAIRIVHDLIGDSNVPVTIRSKSLWGNNRMYATQYRSGRVFCVGDAVHRHPPNNGLGSNSSIQDSYNLAWKLAMVLSGKAGSGLLDSFESERVPVGQQIVLRANKSIDQFAPIFDALGLLEPGTQAELVQRMRARADNTPEAEKQRALLREAIARKNYELSAQGVEMNQRYQSGAIVSDGTEAPKFERDPELYHQATTWPGARIPHCWVARDGHRVSTLDLVGHGQFSLLTGISGRPWVKAAQAASDKLGVPIATHVIGPGCEHTDVYDDWARIREVTEAGCVLVRPDGFVCWRSADLPDAPDQALTSVLSTVLDLA